MWIVKIALQRPYTFIVLAILILLMGVFAIMRTATDIFPNIKIPVVAAIWSYTGLQPRDMANRIVLSTERTAQTTVNDIEHTESQSLNGISVVKYFFQPKADEVLSYSQITGVSQTALRQLPPGTTPPFILAYDASTVPIIQLALSSDSLSEAAIFDVANNVIRTELATIPGAAIPYPYGGRQRQVQIDLDAQALRSKGLSGSDVVSAITSQNLILPAGTQKIGELEYYIGINASPEKVEEMNDLPISASNGSVVFVRDVAHVRDGAPPQTNIARMEGRRAALMSILKIGKTSTLDVINAIKAKMPQVQAAVPPSLKIQPIGDQSVFVKASISGVIREATIAACLTGLMILLFLGSWRSTLIIFISIPLSILASIACLAAIGETINIMTLGGLALAVGILVDDATVTIENINSHLEQGGEVEESILQGANQIALPALVSTLAICIVFVPMFLLAGIAKFLFVPLAEAVVFAMLASYLLSRTLVPTLSMYWLKKIDKNSHAKPPQGRLAFLKRWQQRFEQRFEKIRDGYHQLLEAALRGGFRFAAIFLISMAAAAILAFPFGHYLPGLGQDFFPVVDAGQIKLHLRARTGMRIEDTAALCDQVEALIRQVIPAEELQSVVDNIGLPYSGINLSYSTSAPVGPSDADIFVALKEDHHPSDGYIQRMRSILPDRFPGVSFAFLPADIVTQTLNFGLPSPIDVQVSGINTDANREIANSMLQKFRGIPGAVDLRVQQAFDYPTVNVDVDRTKARQLGLTQQNVASNLLVSLSGSFQTQPSFWTDPKTGTQYNVVAQTPQAQLQSLNSLATTPVTTGSGPGGVQLLANLASFRRGSSPAVVSHYNATPVIDIYGTTQGTDLGFISTEVNKIVTEAQKNLPKATHITVRGQVTTMNESFHGLLLGLAGAVVLVYLLIVVNFQSWLDPLVIIMALPAALAGIVWMLFLTHTTVSVPALTGAIMCMGVATANSVLMISFARERMDAGDDAFKAASAAGLARFRPVLMTALAMVIGMIPMALSLGEGAEQNAPLGRAVIGGLVFATVATLFFVPTVFVLIHGREKPQKKKKSDDPDHRAKHGDGSEADRGDTSDHGDTDEPAPRTERSSAHVGRYALILAVVAVLLAVWGIASRVHSRSQLGKETAREATPVVIVQKPSESPPSEDLVLPGSVQAWVEAPIYARTSGYLLSWQHDIGDPVKQGELLAEIDTPEVDQQLRQSQADLATAVANADLARTTDVRWKGLLANQAVSQQDADTRSGQAQASKAQAASAQANVQRLRELEGFKRIVAPFDGVVTARNTDIGALIAAGQTSGNALFRVADTHRLRVYVDVPEPYAGQTKPGVQVALRFNEHPGKDFPADLARTARALDPTLRTLRVEVQVDNTQGELFPGAYAEVHFKLPGSASNIRIPATALIFRNKGLQVAVIGQDKKAHLHAVVQGRDFGTTIEVLSGLTRQDDVVINPPDSLSDNAPVQVAPPPKDDKNGNQAKKT